MFRESYDEVAEQTSRHRVENSSDEHAAHRLGL
jgi:hypothetical protein